jgi:hypothetical protein
MKFSFTLVFFIFLGSLQLLAQSIQGRVIEAKTQKGIPFVTIQLGDGYGVISNDEGYFILQRKPVDENTPLIFSSMGFEAVEIPLKDFKNDQVIELSPATYELDEVLLFDKQLTVEDILQRFIDHRKENHQIQNSKIQIFTRYNDTYQAKTFGIDVEKASFLSKADRKDMNKRIESLGGKIKSSPSVSYQERLSEVFIYDDTLITSHKKAMNLINRDKTFNTDDIQEQVFYELMSTLKSPHSFKVRTGIIPLGKDISLSELIEDLENDKKNQNVPDTLKNKSNYRAKAYKRYAMNFNHDFLTTPKYYEYELVGVTKAYGQPCYHIKFTPDRRKAKYVGDLYIHTRDFGMVSYKYELEEGKKAMNVNLKFVLGIKASTFVDSGFYVFSKTNDERYFPKYVKKTDGNYAYINRSLAFKENNPNRSDRKKLKLEFELEYDLLETMEYVGIQFEDSSFDALPSLSQDDYILIDELSTYDPNYWSDYNIIKATEAIETYE